MTTEIAPYGGDQSSAVQQFAQGDLNTGLDDFGIEEIPTPRLKILHREGQYQDSQTDVVFFGFNAVILGLVKQRIMWDGEDVEGNKNDVPKCKSNDYERGMPNVDPTSLRQFPWDEQTTFRRELAFPDPALNRVMLPCGNCEFKEWRTKAGTSERIKPRCSEVWNLVLMYDPYGDGQLQPAFLALKKSAIANAKKYLAGFRQRGIGAYTEWTQFTLEQESRGQTVFSKPVLNAVGATDPANWPQYSANYAALADFARTVRPLEGGASTGMQQQLSAPEFSQPAQGVPQGAVPQAVAQPQPAPAPAQTYAPQQSQQVYTPVPMPPAKPAGEAFIDQLATAVGGVQSPLQGQAVQHVAPPHAVPVAPPAPPVQQAPPPVPAPAPQAPPPPAPPVQVAPPVVPPPAPAATVAPPPAVPSPPPVAAPPAAVSTPVAAPPASPVQVTPPPVSSPAAPVAPAPQAAAVANEPTWAANESDAGQPVDDDELPF